VKKHLEIKMSKSIVLLMVFLSLKRLDDDGKDVGLNWDLKIWDFGTLLNSSIFF
jgi:hypothetical protein